MASLQIIKNTLMDTDDCDESQYQRYIPAKIRTQTTCDLVQCIISVLNNLTRDYSMIADNVFTISRCTVPLLDFITRCQKYLHACDSELILAIIYIDRFVSAYTKKNGENILTPTTVHKIFATALILAQKYNTDEYYKLDHIVKVLGVSKKTYINCECMFLQNIDSELYVSLEEYNCYSDNFNQMIEQQLF